MTIRWDWRKSSRSATNGQCVEIGTSVDAPMIAIRDSKSGDDSSMLMLTSVEIGAFLGEVKQGKFDPHTV
jgi:hypothetical protein